MCHEWYSMGTYYSGKCPRLYTVIRRKMVMTTTSFWRSHGREVPSLSDLLFLRNLSLPSLVICLCLPDSVPSPLPAGQEGRGRSGQFAETISPSIPLPSFPPLSQHCKAPCPLWLLTLMWARERLRSGLACVWATDRERAPAPVCMRLHLCVCDRPKSTTKESSDCFCSITTSSFCVQQTRVKCVLSALLLWLMCW